MINMEILKQCRTDGVLFEDAANQLDGICFTMRYLRDWFLGVHPCHPRLDIPNLVMTFTVCHGKIHHF